MTSTFIAAFSTVTGKCTIHADWCDVPTRRGNGLVPYHIDAATPEEAAAIYSAEEELNDRGMPLPKICKCATL